MNAPKTTVVELKIVGTMNYETGVMSVHLEGPLNDIFTCDGLLGQARRLLDTEHLKNVAAAQRKSPPPGRTEGGLHVPVGVGATPGGRSPGRG